MKTYLVQLQLTCSADVESPAAWNWANIINGGSDNEPDTPFQLLSCVELDTPLTAPAVTLPTEPVGPVYTPIAGPIKVGEATFEGVTYDAIKEEACDGCAFKEDSYSACESRECRPEDSFGMPVIFIKQHKD